MWTRGRGALGGAVAAWVLVVGCGDSPPGGRGAAAALPRDLQRDLRLAAAATLALAGPGGPTTRFVPAAEEAPPARVARRAARPERRRTVRAAVRTPAAPPDAPPVAPPGVPVAAAATEPATERIVRYAGEEGASTMLVGVVLRGGAVGDDQCERALPRAGRMRAAVAYRPATIRAGLPVLGPRPGSAVPVAPPF